MKCSRVLARVLTWLGTLGACLAWVHAAAAATLYSEREDVRHFISQMQSRHGFDANDLSRIFENVVPQAAAIKFIMPPKDPSIRSWQAYRSRFVEPRRIARGLQFWQDHQAALEAAARQYGVPEEIIVAIIGVETIYGRHIGRFPVLDTLTTLAFDYPPRAQLFRRELEAFLLLNRETEGQMIDAQGSFAGAIGLPQFLPSSIRDYAIDFDGDNRIDLSASAPDAIGSVARFLKEHGWHSGGIVAVKAELADGRHAAIADGGVLPRFTPSELAEFGVSPAESLPADSLSVLVDLVTPDGPTEYWLGLQNFYVLTRYNRSSFYAMAVYELSRELRAARAGGRGR